MWAFAYFLFHLLLVFGGIFYFFAVIWGMIVYPIENPREYPKECLVQTFYWSILILAGITYFAFLFAFLMEK